MALPNQLISEGIFSTQFLRVYHRQVLHGHAKSRYGRLGSWYPSSNLRTESSSPLLRFCHCQWRVRVAREIQGRGVAFFRCRPVGVSVDDVHFVAPHMSSLENLGHFLPAATVEAQEDRRNGVFDSVRANPAGFGDRETIFVFAHPAPTRSDPGRARGPAFENHPSGCRGDFCGGGLLCAGLL